MTLPMSWKTYNILPITLSNTPSGNPTTSPPFPHPSPPTNPHRIHWFACDKILKVAMPSKLHECPAEWLNEMTTKACRNGLIAEVWDETMRISPSPEYNNFVGKYAGSVKEADWTFLPLVGPDRAKKAEFPSVVLESGCSESAKKLHRDARLWKVGSGGEVRVVLQVKFYQPDT
ncbi:hypothetical protein L873DRAFT_615409 [Choiromyces venosus 120613-1]|uniref:Uncharacterized protein n=1 Tax=Choiromyces venosus 120613-1 TaxID=1336337 RepID=A0A3N4J744_9PEZI|nr:hypothetical protein L873DRAFT_615409 [Choiromyces venosus 120613-1]